MVEPCLAEPRGLLGTASDRVDWDLQLLSGAELGGYKESVQPNHSTQVR